ncbi:MAG TPA: phage tail assembly protein [Sporosarcina psychrophila]|uniref:Phage tail assembly protein n=1 Tax=Sporosarcina psychrophila TaxID=1476 RepID=A0A921KFB1_SPOPS|nr:phage tail assembly protein [Sporosarcina psychrophila]
MPEKENKFLVTFKKPYLFEGTEYNEVDLSKLDDLSTGDLIKADGQFSQIGQFSVMNELTTGYACILSAKATGKPTEFFDGLPAREGLKVKNIVMGFLNE